MEIILKQDVKHVGSKDDLVKVKNGFGSNYLLPKGFAILATESAKKQLDETKKQRAHKEEKIRVAAEGQAKWFEDKVIQPPSDEYIIQNLMDKTKAIGGLNGNMLTANEMGLLKDSGI
jgi:ribosomal protein L9